MKKEKRKREGGNNFDYYLNVKNVDNRKYGLSASPY